MKKNGDEIKLGVGGIKNKQIINTTKKILKNKEKYIYSKKNIIK